MKLTGLYDFADHTLVDAGFILPLLGKTKGKSRILSYVALNGMVVISLLIVTERRQGLPLMRMTFPGR